jgi:hypothetical protein
MEYSFFMRGSLHIKYLLGSEVLLTIQIFSRKVNHITDGSEKHFSIRLHRYVFIMVENRYTKNSGLERDLFVPNTGLHIHMLQAFFKTTVFDFIYMKGKGKCKVVPVLK